MPDTTCKNVIHSLADVLYRTVKHGQMTPANATFNRQMKAVNAFVFGLSK